MVVGFGIVLGAVLNGTPLNLVLGTLAAVLALGAAAYRPALGLALLALTYPFDLTTYAGPLKLTTSAALLVILTVALMGRWALHRASPSPRAAGDPPPLGEDWVGARGWGFRRTPLDIPVAIFGIATVLSLAGLGGHYSDQLVALVKAGGGFLLFFITTQSLRERRDAWLVIGAGLAAGLLLAATTIAPVLLRSTVVSDQTRATGDLIDPNLYAGYLVLLIPLVLAAGLALRWRFAPLLTGAVSLVFLGALVATLSRGGWLGAAIGIGVLLLLLPGRRKLVLAIVGAVLIILLLGGLAGPVGDRLGASAGPNPAATLHSRFPIWSFAITLVPQHPLFGIGVNNFGNYVDALSPDLGVNQAHDLFLNILVERGLIGLTAFAIFLFVLFRTLTRASRDLPRSPAAGQAGELLVAGLIASFAAFLGDSIFDVAYYDYKILLLFWLLAGVAACLPLPPRRVLNGAP